MEYPKTSKKRALQPGEAQALVDLVAGRGWRVLKKYLDQIVTSQTNILNTSDSLEKILRAQGAKRVYADLENRILDVVKDARNEREEEN